MRSISFMSREAVKICVSSYKLFGKSPSGRSKWILYMQNESDRNAYVTMMDVLTFGIFALGVFYALENDVISKHCQEQ